MTRNRIFRFGFALLILGLISLPVLAQGRGKGNGRGRNVDVFSNGRDARIDRINGRGRNQDWKCSVFVNCHDARNGRLDGRGPRVNGNRVFVSRGDRVGYRRYNMNDYWQRRHLTYGTRYHRAPRFR